MPTPQKEQLIGEVAESIRGSSAIYLLSFSGLSVAALETLRGQVYEAGGRLQVVKNRLLRLALAAAQAEPLDAHLKGPTLVAFCPQDPVAPAQAMAKFAEANPGLSIKAGLVEGRVISAAQAEVIAKLPPMPVLLAQIVGMISSPASGLVGILNAAISELVYVMEAYEEKQGAA